MDEHFDEDGKMLSERATAAVPRMKRWAGQVDRRGDAYLIAVTVLGADESAQEALFDLLADVAYSWGERHNLEIFCAGRPAPDEAPFSGS